MGRTHSLTGAVVWIAVGPHLTTGPVQLGAGLAVAGLAALGPDVDHGQSTVSHRLWGPLHSLIGTRIGRLLGGHRQGAHSLLSVAAVYAATALTAPWVGGLWLADAAALGWAAHIAGDLLTDRGVGICWPVTKRRFRVGNITTGSWVETLFRAALYVTGVWLLLGPPVASLL